MLIYVNVCKCDGQDTRSLLSSLTTEVSQCLSRYDAVRDVLTQLCIFLICFMSSFSLSSFMMDKLNFTVELVGMKSIESE